MIALRKAKQDSKELPLMVPLAVSMVVADNVLLLIRQTYESASWPQNFINCCYSYVNNFAM